MIKSVRIKVVGKVQHVGFRYYTTLEARKLRIKGFVKNEYDGSVYIEAEGILKDLNEFISWCESCPDLAIIDKVIFKDSELKNFKSFDVR